MIMRWMIYNTDGCYKIDDNEMHIGDNEMLMLSDELELLLPTTYCDSGSGEGRDTVTVT